MKNRYRIIAMIVCILTCFNFNGTNIFATQSMTDHFSTNYVLTGDAAEDLVAVAMAQKDRTTSQMGYTEDWCGNFVSDCANLAGISNLIPANGLASGLYTAVKRTGGLDVTTPQRGDLVFYNCKECGRIKHVGIMVNATSSIDGNYSNKVTLHPVNQYNDGSHYVSKGQIECLYVRPAYSGGVINPYPIGSYEIATDPGSNLLIRDQAVTGNVVGKVISGTIVQVEQVSKGWGYISYNNIKGWISLDYCIFRGSSSGNAVDVDYQTHVEDIGWQAYVMNGALSGTSGQCKRLEAIRIKLNQNASPTLTGGIEYSTHVQDIGWQGYVANDTLAGTTGQSKRLEAIKIRLTGQLAEKYDVYYRVHCQDFGWLDWAKNNQPSGTAGYLKRLEAIEIKLVEKNGQAPGPTACPYADKYEIPNVNYSTHIQDIGWQNAVSNGDLSGTTGLCKRLEGIKINLSSSYSNSGVIYSTHVQNIGWQNSVSDGEMAGTTGQCKRLEAIKIQLNDTASNFYDIYYRVHSQDYGWLGWAKNGEPSGTSGQSKRLEAIQIQIVPKGSAAPGETTSAFISQ